MFYQEFQSRNRGSFDFKDFQSTSTAYHHLKFQSRNRGSFDFKSSLNIPSEITTECFNLVIEVLLISRKGARLNTSPCFTTFQSRNRGSFDFKARYLGISEKMMFSFQSRNRGSFDFKVFGGGIVERRRSKFQSRNRGSFDFKPIQPHKHNSRYTRFNLVIEVLLISRKRFRSWSLRRWSRFNLVIEVLLISSIFPSGTGEVPKEFQSRNRGSFDFKKTFPTGRSIAFR